MNTYTLVQSNSDQGLIPDELYNFNVQTVTDEVLFWAGARITQGNEKEGKDRKDDGWWRQMEKHFKVNLGTH